ncbi:proton-conducting transporter transmembrane domain-containing protein [Adhaeretor mobilis]|uniref:NADH-quinone oxidoreductase subunit L n=1 Tax=Adhaeretor mobilis TaxID=1930276 RepID=A0A517MZL0_9BACT|nr:proton-conducting transporter membrane subunit [Adhaeretor mobilis]QDT00238.1 NADH-quinone oxidoreductase subunit L [Adhaeretor mobilis]
MEVTWEIFVLGLVVIASPLALVAVLGTTALIGKPLSESKTQNWTYATTIIGLIAALAILAMMLADDKRYIPIELGNWVAIPDQHFHFSLKFVFDRLSVPFVILSYVLCGTIGAFTSRYLHREPGYLRFYVCYSFFVLGMIVSSLAGTIEVLFLGWELVGLSSALLVAFFHDRKSPVRNGLRVWSVYRVSDAAFLVAAVALHHLTGGGDFGGLMGIGSWPDGIATLTSEQAMFVGLLLLVAAAGKSALVPFSGWLPRAMEGPTPSSAIFYGALSVHLGAFLLLRISPILELSLILSVTVVAIGLVTAIFASVAARVQTDIKSALAYASLTQVGIIVAEIGLGLRYIALIHIIGHACLRTLQLLRAPTLLHDYQVLENAIGQQDATPTAAGGHWTPTWLRERVYRFASERGHLDSLIDSYVVYPIRRVLLQCDAWERAWTDFLSGTQSRESDAVPVHDDVVEELRL